MIIKDIIIFCLKNAYFLAIMFYLQNNSDLSHLCCDDPGRCSLIRKLCIVQQRGILCTYTFRLFEGLLLILLIDCSDSDRRICS